MLPIMLFVNKVATDSVDPVRTYTFTGCTVISKDFGDLNAEASGLLVEMLFMLEILKWTLQIEKKLKMH